MEKELNYNFGPQPLIQLMEKHALKSHDLVANSTDQITHKMITRAMKGRKLKSHVKVKITAAINNAAKQKYIPKNLFNY